MNQPKQFLFPANSYYFGPFAIAALFLTIELVGLFLHPDVFWAQGGIEAIGSALLLCFAAMWEGAMMVKTDRFLCAYRSDRALCIPLEGRPLDEAFFAACKLYGPTFEPDAVHRFSDNPPSPWMRKAFYTMVACLFAKSLAVVMIRVRAYGTPMPSPGQWALFAFDALLLFNRLFFRAGIRRFWAALGVLFGNRQIRDVLQAEISGVMPASY
jgi:hypothetical protein